MNVSKIIYFFLSTSYYAILLGCMLGIMPSTVTAQVDNNSNSQTTSSLPDYTTHRSQFFNYDVYKNLDQSKTSTSVPRPKSPSSSLQNAYTLNDDVEYFKNPNAPVLDQPVFMLNNIYSNFYIGVGQMSDYTNKVDYHEIILGTKNYKFLWINPKETLGFYTGLDLNLNFGIRSASQRYNSSVQLSSTDTNTNTSSAHHRPVFDHKLFNKYNSYGFNTSILLLSGIKINVYRRLSVLAELGGGVNYNFFTLPSSTIDQQFSSGFKYGVVGGQLQGYLGFDYNSTFECGVRITGSSTGYSSFSFLISLTY